MAALVPITGIHQCAPAAAKLRYEQTATVSKRGGWPGLKEPWNILGPVYPRRRTSGETLVFVRHFVLSSFSFWVLKFLR